MNPKPYLVVLHPHFTLPGGAGKYMMEIVKRCTDEYDVIAISQHSNEEWRKQFPEVIFEDLNGPLTSSVWFWLLWPLWYVKIARKLSKLGKSREVILFCNVFPAHWFGLLYKKIHPAVRCVWLCAEPSAFIHFKHWRNAIPSWYKRIAAHVLAPVFSVIDIWLVKASDAIIADSKYTQRHITEIYHQSSVLGYPGIVALPILVPPIKQRTKRIITVGRLTKFKRVDVLVRGFVKANLSDYQFDIIGAGEEKESLQKLIDQLHCSDRVNIRSGVDDDTLAKMYTDARLFMLGSQGEPFGIVAVEAMVYGTPVLADNSGGPAETVLAGKTGKLITMNEAEISEALKELLNNEDRLEQYSQQAQVWAKQTFQWEVVVHTTKLALHNK